MSTRMTHDDAFAALEAAALDALSEQEQREVIAHAATCPECGPALLALRDAGALVALAAPPVPVEPARRAAQRAKLLARANDERQGVVIDLPSEVVGLIGPTQRARRGWAPWLALAAGIAFVVSSALLALTWQDRERLRTSLATMSASDSTSTVRLDSARTALAAAERVLQSIGGSRLRVVSLTASGARPPVGWMFWEQDKNRWTLLARDLPAPAAGRTYQLWLVSKGAKISAGTFQPDVNGQAVKHTDYPLAADALDGIAVTEEPIGGVPIPTGQIVLSGK